ncbi:hypothetical protein B0H63DRAFT_96984 [Podospora didyma]|uniref:Uncharacterized protein n=1 Tax=Podospora didyma TaxID=330526 RepID=A0AAE0U3I8_9PEZI|nr:hypothetical protein B0H63DRAFT_96984 [Podospora didyma]
MAVFWIKDTEQNEAVSLLNSSEMNTQFSSLRILSCKTRASNLIPLWCCPDVKVFIIFVWCCCWVTMGSLGVQRLFSSTGYFSGSSLSNFAPFIKVFVVGLWI